MIKEVPLEDFELWPDEVTCFTAWTYRSRPVPEKRNYVAESKYKRLKEENESLRDMVHSILVMHSCPDTFWEEFDPYSFWKGFEKQASELGIKALDE